MKNDVKQLKLTLQFDKNAQARVVVISSRYIEHSIRSDLVGVKSIFKHLAGSLGEGILYKYVSKISELIINCDGDHPGDTETCKRTTGYVLMSTEGPVAWCSRRQPIVALSSNKAEFIAAAECCKEALFLKSLKKLTFNINTTFIIDNQSAIHVMKTDFF